MDVFMMALTIFFWGLLFYSAFTEKQQEISLRKWELRVASMEKKMEHFEICPVTQSPVTRKPSEEEIERILNNGGRVSVYYYRYLDNLPPISFWENQRGEVNMQMEYTRLYHHLSKKEKK